MAAKLTSQQRIYLDSLTRHGSVTATGHDRRVLDSLVRKGLATPAPTSLGPHATVYRPTPAGMSWETDYRRDYAAGLGRCR